MSPISPLTTNFYPVQRSAGAVDSDGDHDGSKPGEIESAEAQTLKTPTPPKPTDTAGNHINTYA
ncbi:MAG: hypothetical protein JO370_05395 [Paucibacter sp.]|nr:hypothetical protein [Roseateles sp.]